MPVPVVLITPIDYAPDADPTVGPDTTTPTAVVPGQLPIGSVYISTTAATEPSAILGYGTWSYLGAGRTLVGVDTGDADFDTPKKTAGAKTVAAAGANSAPTFTGNSQGDHLHGITGIAVTLGSPDGTQNRGATGTQVAVASSAHTHGSSAASGNTDNQTPATPTGAVSAPAFTGSATSVVQPSIAVYFWERTA